MLLPSLDKNIKNGNSLISGSDKELRKYFGKNYRDIKPFNWQEEFPEVFKQGGFGVIVGNPPWVFTREGDFSIQEKSYFRNFLNQLGLVQTEKGRNIQSGKINLYSLFVLKATTLLRRKGIVSFIIPNNILRATNFDLFRKYVLSKTKILEIDNLGEGIFPTVTASSIIFSLEKESDENKKANNMIKVVSNVIDLGNKKYSIEKIPQRQFINNVSYTFNILSTSGFNSLSNKIEKDTVPLGLICKYISPGIDGDKSKYVAELEINNFYKPLLFGKNFGRYYRVIVNI